MPSIHKRHKSPFWICQFCSADGRWLKRSTKLRDRRRALEWCHALQQAQDLIGQGSPPEAQLREIISETMMRVGGQLTTPSVRSWFTAWLNAREGATSPGTLFKYQGAIRSFLEFLGPRADSRLETISQPDIVAFRNALIQQGKVPATINQTVSRIIAAPLVLAFKQGHLRHNPIAGLPRLADASRGRKQPFTLEDIRRLLEASEGDWRGLILAAYGTGARLSDLVNLKWSDVDFENQVISFVQRKTGRPIVVGLHPDLGEWLQTQPHDAAGQIFPKLANRRTAGRGGLSGKFAEIMRQAGIQSEEIRTRKGQGRSVHAKSFHSLRHTAASSVFTSKIVEETVKRQTGHSGQSHRIYTHANLEAIRAACALIPRI